MAGRRFDVWETRGADLVARLLDGDAEPRDTECGPDEVHDFDIKTADGLTVALEVTRAANREVISQRTAAFNKTWSTPRLDNDWWVTLGPVNRQTNTPIIDVVKALVPLLETFESLGLSEVEAWYDMRYLPPPEGTPQELHEALIKLYAIGSTGTRSLGPRKQEQASILFSLTGCFTGDPGRLNDLVAERAQAKVKKLRKASADERHLMVWMDLSEPAVEICISKVGSPISVPEIPSGIDVVWITNPNVEKVWRLKPPGGWEILVPPAEGKPQNSAIDLGSAQDRASWQLARLGAFFTAKPTCAAADDRFLTRRASQLTIALATPRITTVYGAAGALIHRRDRQLADLTGRSLVASAMARHDNVRDAKALVPPTRRSASVFTDMSVLTPTDGIDPRVALASSVHASPGVYAVLVGSGLSTAAGIPTGWGIVEALVTRVAALEGVELGDRRPAEWFEATYGHAPRYDDLLERLAKSDHTRRALLREYFDGPPGSDGPPEPTIAHRVLAELCAQGRVRVLLTTNFDHLLERALNDAGASPQILITADDRAGMEPFQHARTTLIKLHGDYRSPMLNTAEELGEYPDDLRALVDEVLDRYGVIVAGWSADYDRALEGRLAACQSRRYPMYWLRHRGELTESAAALIAARRATIIDIDGADEFFSDLAEKLARLDNIAIRRQQPAALWDSHHAPRGGRHSGWQAVPLLQLRTVAVLDSVRRDDCSPIGPSDREAVVAALDTAAFSTELNAVADRHPIVSASLESNPGDTIMKSYPLNRWIPTPGGFQNLAAASYRLGGDATSGISALLEIWLPRPQSGSVLVTLDTALSLRSSVDITDAVRLWQAGVILATGAIPDALRSILPEYADVTQVELHVIAPSHTVDGAQRATSLLDHLDLRRFGEHTDETPAALGQAMRVSGALGALEAADLVVDALDRMLLDGGFLDPRVAISSLRDEARLWTVGAV